MDWAIEHSQYLVGVLAVLLFIWGRARGFFVEVCKATWKAVQEMKKDSPEDYGVLKKLCSRIHAKLAEKGLADIGELLHAEVTEAVEGEKVPKVKRIWRKIWPVVRALKLLG